MNMVKQYFELQDFFECSCIDIHHTPDRSLCVNVPHVDYIPSPGTYVHSPITVFQSSPSKQVSNNFSGQYRN